MKLLLALALSIMYSISPLNASSIKEVHRLSNEITVAIGDSKGDFCSGTVVDKANNIVATANHCVVNLSVTVMFKDWTGAKAVNKFYQYYKPGTVRSMKFKDDGTVYSKTICDAKVVSVDKLHDTAIMQVDKMCIFNAEAKLSQTPVEFGDIVYTAGNPFMLYGAIAMGYVTQPKVYHDYIMNGEAPAILFQGQLAPGSSGGALINDKNEMVGLTNWGTGMLAMASPVEHLRALLKKAGYEK